MSKYVYEPYYKVKNSPKIFHDVCNKIGPYYYSYQGSELFCQINWSTPKHYICGQKLGRGRFAQVFSAINLNNSKDCAIKILKKISVHKITKEIKILWALGGHQSFIQLLDNIKYQSDQCYYYDIYMFVFEKMHQTNTLEILQNASPLDFKLYMLQLISALHYMHSCGIMHRDIKPGNILIDTKKKNLKIIDFGFSEFYMTYREFHSTVGTRYYKAPELIVDHRYHHYAVDIWSFGIMFSGLIFGHQPLLRGKDNWDQLIKIIEVLGLEDLQFVMDKNYLNIHQDQMDKLTKNFKSPKLTFRSFVNEENKHRCTPEVLDLIQGMLIYDYDKRLTAEEIIKSPYFDEVRQFVNIRTCERIPPEYNMTKQQLAVQRQKQIKFISEKVIDDKIRMKKEAEMRRKYNIQRDEIRRKKEEQNAKMGIKFSSSSGQEQQKPDGDKDQSPIL